jgi:hypothetical protein
MKGALAMRRLWVCLPICLVLAPEPLPPDGARAGRTPPAPAARARPADDKAALPDNATMEELARTDPIAFLQNCLRRSDRTVRGYRTTLQKQERIKGVLQPTEVIDVSFREKPFSVLMVWRRGARLAQRMLYVEGENDNKLLVLPAGWRSIVGVVERDPNGPDVRDSSRYPPTEFGMPAGTQKALDAWLAARKRGDLKVTFKGEKKVKEAGNRLCWVLERTGYTRREEDGITRSTFYFDKESWLMVGSVLKGEEDKLLGSYFFRDVELNPTFPPGTFTRASLRR